MLVSETSCGSTETDLSVELRVPTLCRRKHLLQRMNLKVTGLRGKRCSAQKSQPSTLRARSQRKPQLRGDMFPHVSWGGSAFDKTFSQREGQLYFIRVACVLRAFRNLETRPQRPSQSCPKTQQMTSLKEQKVRLTDRPGRDPTRTLAQIFLGLSDTDKFP